MRTPSTLVAALTLVVVAACGASGQVSSGSASTSTQPLAQGAGPGEPTMRFGDQYRFGDGVTIVISSPKSFNPSGSAYPHSNRAVGFEIAIRNDSDQSYRLSGLAVSATVDGAVAKQLVDSTQGYSGITDAGRDVQPGRDTRVVLAFAVPDLPSPIQLTVRPAATSQVVAIYSGST